MPSLRDWRTAATAVRCAAVWCSTVRYGCEGSMWSSMLCLRP